MLGKRLKSPEEEIEGANKRAKRDETKIDAKLNDKEEEKKGEDLQPTRRSGRNLGKEANYNIDELLDAADQEAFGNGGKGGGCISVMLAQSYSPEILEDPTGWLISEKLDGVRCYWNGQTMYTRNGHPFYPPDWFKKLLPADLCLDGELFTERGDFQKIVSIVRR